MVTGRIAVQKPYARNSYVRFCMGEIASATPRLWTLLYTMRKVRGEKPSAGNLHVRFDEGEVAPAAMPRRGSLLYKFKGIIIITSLLLLLGCGKGENNALRERVENSEVALKASQENVAALQQENNKLREKLSASEKELEGKKIDIERQNLDLAKKNDELRVKNNELEMTQKNLESKNEDLRVKRAELESKNDELEKRRKELESKNEELEAKRKDLETTKGQNNKLVWMIPLLVSVALAVGTLMGLKVRGDVRKASAKAEQGDNGPWGYDR